MITEVLVGETYLSRTGIRFKVLSRAKHAQDCSVSMIIYTNLSDTTDSKTGTVWVLDESLFLKLFTDMT